jgi:hypothetical protein
MQSGRYQTQMASFAYTSSQTIWTTRLGKHVPAVLVIIKIRYSSINTIGYHDPHRLYTGILQSCYDYIVHEKLYYLILNLVIYTVHVSVN